MKKNSCCILLLLLISAALSGSPDLNNRFSAPANPDVPVSSIAPRWVAEHFAKGKIPPFSFVYGGKKSDGFIRTWRYKAGQIHSTEPNTQMFQYTYTDPHSGMVVTCTVTAYLDFPAAEWVLHFCNASARNLELLEKAAVIDQVFEGSAGGDIVVHHAKGSNALRTDFQPVDQLLQIKDSVYMSPSSGRSSDNAAFPFFNIELPGKQGIMVAVGWTGKWYAEVQRTGERSAHLRSGMERMRLRLFPKEQIRTPRICLLFWKGNDRMTGHNQFRQFVLQHHTRRIDGQPAQLPLASFLARGGPLPCNEHVCATEEYAVSQVARHQQFGIVPEVFWMDAGWYACKGQWPNTGNWTPNKENFPNGFKPVTDAVHRAGAKFLLWFEPERVTEGTEFADKNPDWVRKIAGSTNFLFDLGNDSARLWMTGYISALLQKDGIDYYRQDCNFDPMPYWQSMDAPDRTGMAEIRHIEGLYAFWDSLLVRFPNLVIDNCASGGRRLDLETISRSSPLWRTDYNYGEPNGSQCHTYGINFYLPLSGTGNVQTAPYATRSAMSSSIALMWDINNSGGSLQQMQQCMREFKMLRPYYYGDYYPLTGTTGMTSDSVWLAYELHRRQNGDGVIMAFRRQDCADSTLNVQLRGLEEGTSYILKDEDTGMAIRKTGKELQAGFLLTIREKRGSLLLTYRSDAAR